MSCQFFCFGLFPVIQQTTNDGRTDTHPVDRTCRNPHDLHPAGNCRFAIATVVSETVIETGDKCLGSDTFEKNPFDELRARQRTECLIERNDDQCVDSQLLQQHRFFIERSQQTQSVRSSERYPRMRVESQHDTLAVDSLRLVDKLLNQCLMAPMHPIERTDRDGRVPKTWQNIEPMINLHIGQLLLSLSFTK